jgi:hypothetical protein
VTLSALSALLHVRDPDFPAVQCGIHACFTDGRLQMTIVFRVQVFDSEERNPEACHFFYRGA